MSLSSSPTCSLLESEVLLPCPFFSCSCSLDVARQQVIAAQSVGLDVSHQLHEREEEARLQQLRTEAAGKLLRQAQKRLQASEQLMVTVREQHREFKLLHARHAESLEENQQLRLELEILEAEKMQLLQQAEASRHQVLELLETKRTAETLGVEVTSLEGKLREFEKDREVYRLLELHAEELENRLEAKEEQVRLWQSSSLFRQGLPVLVVSGNVACIRGMRRKPCVSPCRRIVGAETSSWRILGTSRETVAYCVDGRPKCRLKGVEKQAIFFKATSQVTSWSQLRKAGVECSKARYKLETMDKNALRCSGPFPCSVSSATRHPAEAASGPA